MERRQSYQGILKDIRCTKAIYKQTDKKAKMATEQDAITQVIIQAVIEATKPTVHEVMLQELRHVPGTEMEQQA